jgi:hypothetical protein
MKKGTAAYDSITNEIKAAAQRGDNGIERMFIGSQDEVAQIILRDKQGRIRAKLYVDQKGSAKLEFLDEKGTIIHTLPNQ